MSSTGPLKLIEFFTSTLNEVQMPRITERGKKVQLHTAKGERIAFGVLEGILRGTKESCVHMKKSN